MILIVVCLCRNLIAILKSVLPSQTVAMFVINAFATIRCFSSSDVERYCSILSLAVKRPGFDSKLSGIFARFTGFENFGGNWFYDVFGSALKSLLWRGNVSLNLLVRMWVAICQHRPSRRFLFAFLLSVAISGITSLSIGQ